MAYLRRKPNSKYFIAAWKDENGKRIDRSTKIEAKSHNRRQAQKIADEFEKASKVKRTARQVREVISDFHQDLTGEELPSPSVAEYCKMFLEQKKGEVKQATINYYQTAINNFTEWLGERANEDMSSIRTKDIVGFRNKFSGKLSEKTITAKLKALRAIFTCAVKEGMCLEDPTQSLKLSQKANTTASSTKRRAFTLDELKIIKAKAHSEWKSMFFFGLYTGQRLGDLATLKWNSIDTLRRQIRLQTRKTNKPIVIPYSEALEKHIKNIARCDGSEEYVHPELAKTYLSVGSSTLSNQFNRLLASCGLRDTVSHKSKGIGRDAMREQTTLSFHSLRATAVTWMHDTGIPPAIVQEWVGHDSVEVHRGYIKLGVENLRKASNSLPNI